MKDRRQIEDEINQLLLDIDKYREEFLNRNFPKHSDKSNENNYRNKLEKALKGFDNAAINRYRCYWEAQSFPADIDSTEKRVAENEYEEAAKELGRCTRETQRDDLNKYFLDYNSSSHKGMLNKVYRLYSELAKSKPEEKSAPKKTQAWQKANGNTSPVRSSEASAPANKVEGNLRSIPGYVFQNFAKANRLVCSKNTENSSYHFRDQITKNEVMTCRPQENRIDLISPDPDTIKKMFALLSGCEVHTINIREVHDLNVKERIWATAVSSGITVEGLKQEELKSFEAARAQAPHDGEKVNIADRSGYRTEIPGKTTSTVPWATDPKNSCDLNSNSSQYF